MITIKEAPYIEAEIADAPLEHVPIEQAAKELGLTVTDCKARMRLNLIHIGHYVLTEGHRRGRYRVIRPMLDEEKRRFGRG